jgi:glycine cleavage system H lipoate-binding protein
VSTEQEISHGRIITWTLRAKDAPHHIRESLVGNSWIVEMTATGTRDG